MLGAAADAVTKMEPDPDHLHRLALLFVPDVGDVMGRTLIQTFGDARAAFAANLKALLSVPGMGEARAYSLRKEGDAALLRADAELKFCEKHGISVLHDNSDAYPSRLRACADAPLALFYKGAGDLNAAKSVAIVGTRRITDYGTRLAEELADGLSAQGVLVCSGLAQGVDAVAHKRTVERGGSTVGVVAHGLDRMYPQSHRALAASMMEKGGVLTEFSSESPLHPNNFPVRNRIVAGMADVTVVVESDLKGGAMITAYLAHGYNREVAAFPGRVGDSRSAGCNALIGRSVASLITCADDLLNVMGWKPAGKQKPVQRQLSLVLSPEEQKVVDALAGKDSVHADDLMLQTGIAHSALAGVLLQLELQGVVKTGTGKMYRLS